MIGGFNNRAGLLTSGAEIQKRVAAERHATEDGPSTTWALSCDAVEHGPLLFASLADAQH